MPIDTAMMAMSPRPMPMYRLVFFGGSRLISKVTSRAGGRVDEWTNGLKPMIISRKDHAEPGHRLTHFPSTSYNNLPHRGFEASCSSVGLRVPHPNSTN